MSKFLVLGLVVYVVANRPQKKLDFEALTSKVEGCNELSAEVEQMRAELRALEDDSLTCEEGQVPTDGDKRFCAYFDGKQDPCHANGCRMMDRMLPDGKLTCEVKKCTDPVLSSTAVPQNVTDAVAMARALIDAKKQNALAMVHTAQEAETAAKQTNEEARDAAAAAATAVATAVAQEESAKAAKDQLDAAARNAIQADVNLKAKSAAYVAAVQLKSQKLQVMKEKLAAKKKKEEPLLLQFKRLKMDIATVTDVTLPDLNKQLQAARDYVVALQAQIASVEEQRMGWYKERTANQKAFRGDGKKDCCDEQDSDCCTMHAIKVEVRESSAAYKAQKDEVDRLQAAMTTAGATKAQANATEKLALDEHLRKEAAWNAAVDAKSAAEDNANTLQDTADQAEEDLLTATSAVHVAWVDLSKVTAFKERIENVYEYAIRFYDNLDKVEEPTAPTVKKKIMLLAQDEAMLPCLASYNTIITEANGLSGQPEILSTLKAGLGEIDANRYSHFEQWCGDIDFASWVWEWNEMEKAEPSFPIS